MSNQARDFGKDQKQRDSGLAAAEISIRRAAAKACEGPRRTGSGITVWKDGHVCQRAVGKSDEKPFFQPKGRRLASKDKTEKFYESIYMV